ncbi:MAG: hypothetical protein DMF76_14655 [Acidobacteria bacterium]|nr:MAG: hypothetical protein DMF76_14655 [Acidobacteriota bacterium]
MGTNMPTHTCPWCGLVSDGSKRGCPACGATIDARDVVTESGWSELPGRKDMAKLQFGNSFCQIEGIYVPVADINLAPGDAVYFAHHVLLWKDPQVTITAMGLKGAFKRLLAGMPLVMTQAQGPGHIAFSRDAPGEMIALPLQPGQAVDVREHLFLVATNQITYDWFQSGVWFTTRSGNESETHYPLGQFMDRFYAPAAPGLLLLHSAGNAFVRSLEPNQTILVKPTALLFKDPTVQMQLHFEHPAGTWSSWRSWGNRYLWLRLYGPGRVAVQSAYSHLHDNGRNITRHSGATVQRWG